MRTGTTNPAAEATVVPAPTVRPDVMTVPVVMGFPAFWIFSIVFVLVIMIPP
jgi:hypothetical protein